ncbi:MAG: surface lipoprotein assembly modifier [Azonexus sp.]|nr:surface lipoprotein assembly modifier [Azonexus sp.]
MFNKSNRMLGLAAACLICCQPLSAWADQMTDEAAALLNAGKGSAAYALLEPQESARAGDTSYDFLLGLAALEVGQNTRAVFALERVLAMEPNHVRARAEIARAYLALGEVETARQEFETVQRQGVPADVSLTLDRYIAAARRMESQSRPKVNGYVEGVLGYDTNVNVGPNRTSVIIPGISSTPATLSNDSRANKDMYGQLGAGVNARVPVSKDVALLAGFSGAQRWNQDVSQFDMGNYDANAGVVVTADKNVFTLMGQFGSVSIDDARYRTAAGVTGQWQYNLDARNQVSAFLQYNNLHYVVQTIRDADRWVGGAAYAHMWRDGVVGFGSIYLVKEKPQADGVDFIGFDGAGVRFGGRANLNTSTTLFGGLSYEFRSYAAVDPSFLTERTDHQYGLLLGATYAFAKDWTLTPQVSLTRNQSNTELNEYHREVVSVAIRREF